MAILNNIKKKIKEFNPFDDRNFEKKKDQVATYPLEEMKGLEPGSTVDTLTKEGAVTNYEIEPKPWDGRYGMTQWDAEHPKMIRVPYKDPYQLQIRRVRDKNGKVVRLDYYEKQGDKMVPFRTDFIGAKGQWVSRRVENGKWVEDKTGPKWGKSGREPTEEEIWKDCEDYKPHGERTRHNPYVRKYVVDKDGRTYPLEEADKHFPFKPGLPNLDEIDWETKLRLQKIISRKVIDKQNQEEQPKDPYKTIEELRQRIEQLEKEKREREGGDSKKDLSSHDESKLWSRIREAAKEDLRRRGLGPYRSSKSDETQNDAMNPFFQNRKKQGR